MTALNVRFVVNPCERCTQVFQPSIFEVQAFIQQTPSKWTDEEVEWLKANSTKGIDYAVEQLNRSYAGIVQKLYKLRLSSRPNKQLKELVVSEKVHVKTEWCNLPTFHPVMLGIYPVSKYSGGSSTRWRKRRAIILKMHDNLCVYCGDEANSVDHVIPINKGGTDDPLNLVAACSRCNSAFGDKTKHIDFKISDVNHSHIVRR
jgi:hypothetical protein